MIAGRPGWVSLFEEQLKEDPSAKSYPFSTYSTADNTPKVRYVVHRSLTPISNLLLTSTDHRMKKYQELEENPNVELAFWMEKTGVQFRISGKAAVLPNKPEEKSALEKILKETLHAKGEEATPEYWVNKRSEEFEKMSGHLRATFARPPPGTPLEDLKEGEKPGDWSESIKPPGEDEKTKSDLARANDNYHLVAISPSSVEMLELKAIPNRRTVWHRQTGGDGNGGDGEWSVLSVAP